MKRTRTQRITSQPSCTIFSIDPATNQPYITVDMATKLIETHIKLHAINLLPRITSEDLTQDLLAKMCRSTFDPTKSSATTFLYTCINTRCATIYNQLFVRNKRHLERSDFLMYTYSDDGSGRNLTYATDELGTELSITPEGLLHVKQLIQTGIDESAGTSRDYSPKDKRKPRELRSTKSED